MKQVNRQMRETLLSVLGEAVSGVKVPEVNLDSSPHETLKRCASLTAKVARQGKEREEQYYLEWS